MRTLELALATVIAIHPAPECQVQLEARQEEPHRVLRLRPSCPIGYASTHVEFINEGSIWALVAYTIFASTVIHGLTARDTVKLLDRDDSAEPSGEPPGPTG